MEQPFKGLFLIFCIPSQESERFGGEKEIRSIVGTNILENKRRPPCAVTRWSPPGKGTVSGASTFIGLSHSKNRMQSIIRTKDDR